MLSVRSVRVTELLVVLSPMLTDADFSSRVQQAALSEHHHSPAPTAKVGRLIITGCLDNNNHPTIRLPFCSANSFLVASTSASTESI